MGFRVCVLIVLATLLASLACDGSDSSPVAPGATLSAPPPSEGTAGVRLDLASVAEATAAQASLAAAGLEVTGGVDADTVVADAPLSGATEYVVVPWVVAAHQRAEVLDLSLDDLRRVLRGEVDDWADLGGRPLPLHASVLAPNAEAIAQALGLDDAEVTATRLDSHQQVERLLNEPGSLAVVPPSSLRPGLQALVLDGHDPYRDPWFASPLRMTRWVQAATPQEAARIAAALGWDRLDDVDPAGLVATGELIPARCSHEALVRAGGMDAMFAATGDWLRAADLAVIPLEVTLTDIGPPTPCIRTFNLQGPAAAVTAMADTGVDVVITAGNHAKDCWECSLDAGLLDTLKNLDDAGLAHAGAGVDLTAARTPAFVEVDGVTFAFLGYDDIASGFYAAGEGIPGTAPLDLEMMRADIAAAKRLADHVLVGYSWGIEYTADPSPRQVEAARVAIDAGATVLLGNHPHWVQALDVQTRDGQPETLVLYALGNFVFDQDWSIETQQGIAVEAGFTSARLLGFRLRPYAIRELHRPEFVDASGEGGPILGRVWEATDRLPAP